MDPEQTEQRGDGGAVLHGPFPGPTATTNHCPEPDPPAHLCHSRPPWRIHRSHTLRVFGRVLGFIPTGLHREDLQWAHPRLAARALSLRACPYTCSPLRDEVWAALTHRATANSVP